MALAIRHGDGIAYLLILRNARAEKLVGIWKGLETRSLTHGERAVLIGKEYGTPMRIAFGHDRAGKTIFAEAAIALRVIGLARPLHALGQE